jgi:hydroxypyruvate isomerase
MRFSANLGFLWRECPLPEAIRAAHAAGFDAVECHWPGPVPAADLRAVLAETGVPLLSLNTAKGDAARGEFGLAAVPGRGAEARDGIDAALAYAEALGASYLHVLAGCADGPRAEAAYLDALAYAEAAAGPAGVRLLIEPLNPADVPGYFLRDLDQALGVLDTIGSDRIRLMVDCYHLARLGEDVCARLEQVAPWIGHVQMAGVPDRGRPDRGTLDYRRVFETLRHIGYDAPIGAEYDPRGPTEESLGWMSVLQRAGAAPPA